MFVTPAERDSAAYREFWAALNRGEFQAGEFKRIGKGGREIWILATYNPILDETGKPFKVVKFATDITEQKLKNADLDGQIDGDRQVAGRDRIQHGRHDHQRQREFPDDVGYDARRDPGQAPPHVRRAGRARKRRPIAQFWAALNRGEYQAGEYKRIGKGGKEVWIQASYNPILDLNGKPYKVVKYATDITAQALIAHAGRTRPRA